VSARWQKEIIIMALPNENLPNVSHNRQFPVETFGVPVSTSPSGLRSISDAGGELPPDLYRRRPPAGSGAKEYRDLKD
jgi:hypothetical protein